MTEPRSTSLQSYLRLLGYLKPNLGIFLLSIVGFLAFSATQPALAHVLEYMVTALEEQDKNARIFIPLAFMGIFLVRGVGTFAGNYFMGRVAFGIVKSLRIELFNHLTVLPSSYYDNHNSGALISKITFDVSRVADAVTDALKVVIREGSTAIFLLAYLFWQNWKLTLIFLVVAPILGAIVSWVSKRMRRLSGRIQDTMGDVTHASSEMISNYRVMRSFGGEAYEKERFARAAQDNYRQNVKLIMMSAASTPFTQMVVVVALCVLIFLALTLTKGQGAGPLIAYIAAATQVPSAVRKLVEVNNKIQQGIAAAESVFKELDVPTEEDHGQQHLERVAGHVSFKHVDFSYDTSEGKVISNFSLDVKPGQVVALVGRSGSGKTTLVALLQRFYNYQGGAIEIDGIRIEDFELANLRSQVALVNQNVDLFNDTVFNNIAYGDMAGSSREAVEQAARLANAWEFIEQLPEGLDTLLGEDGSRLSGGQRQRIAIARALLKDAPILVLDEATSALDNESERLIQDALEKVMTDRTTIVIAHRLSTIENADNIVVMERGQIIEQGTHGQLMARNAAYAKLHAKNFEDEVEA